MHDVFISYSHKDVNIADAVCHRFEEAGIRCWYAPRNIKPGDEWADAIIEALEKSKVMLLIFTDDSNVSVQVHREVDAAVSSGITIIPFKCSDALPSGSMRYYLSTLHWMDAMNAPLEESIERLLAHTKKTLDSEGASESEDYVPAEKPGSVTKPTPPHANPPGQITVSRKVPIALGIVCAGLVVLVLLLTIGPLSGRRTGEEKSAAAPVSSSEEVSAEVQGEQEPAPSPEVSAETVSSDSAAAVTSDSATAEASVPEEDVSVQEAGSAEAAPEQDSENAAVEAAGTETASAADSAAAEADSQSTSESAETQEAQGGFADNQSQKGNGPVEFDDENDSPGAENYLYSYRNSESEVILERYFGPEDAEIVIPAIVDGRPVTRIGEKCFEDHDYIEKVVLPDTMERICYRAFYGCKKLSEMNFPASLTAIEGWVFAHTGFVNIVFPENFEYLGYGMFYSCSNLETVVLTDKIKKIDENTFRSGSSLISVTIPSAEIEINTKAFEPDTDVTLIGVPGSFTEKYAKAMNLKFEEYQG